MDSEMILSWMDEHHIEEQCIERFWELIAYYKAEESEEFKKLIGDEKLLSISPLRMSFDVYPKQKTDAKFSIILNMYLRAEECDNDNIGTLIGYYKEEFLSDGEPFNWYFVLE